MPKFRCVVATPTQKLFSGDIAYANIPGIEGNYGVLSNHEQYVGLNRPGVLTLTLDEEGKETISFAIYNGIAQMFNNHLSILAQLGRAVDDIDVADTRRKLDETVADLEEIRREYDKTDDAQIKTREDYIAWCQTQITIAEGGML